MADIHLNNIVVTEVIVAPDTRQDNVACEHLAWMQEEQLKRSNSRGVSSIGCPSHVTTRVPRSSVIPAKVRISPILFPWRRRTARTRAINSLNANGFVT